MKTRLPDKLTTFPKELFGMLEWAHLQLTEGKDSESNLVLLTEPLPSSSAMRFRFRLNKLRKSLDFWAPNSKDNTRAKNLVFVFQDDKGAQEGFKIVAAHLRHIEKTVDWNKLPGFTEIMEAIEIPEEEKLLGQPIDTLIQSVDAGKDLPDYMAQVLSLSEPPKGE